MAFSDAPSPEYLSCLQQRLPGLQNLSKKALLEALQKYSQREPKEYERFWTNELQDMENEALLEAPDERLFDYLFDELPQEVVSNLKDTMSVVMRGPGKGDIILGSWEAPREADFDQKIGGAQDIHDFQLIHTLHRVSIQRGEQKQLYVTLRIQKSHKQDTYRREYFSVQPMLIEIPDKGSMTPPRLVFTKDLDLEEFKAAMNQATLSL